MAQAYDRIKEFCDFLCRIAMPTTSSGSQQFGIVFFKELLKRGRRPFRELMQLLDHVINVGRHDQQIAQWLGTGIPVGVRRSSRHEDAGARASLNLVVAHPNSQDALEDIPRLIIVSMQMQRRNITRWTRISAGISPFGNDKAVIDGT